MARPSPMTAVNGETLLTLAILDQWRRDYQSRRGDIRADAERVLADRDAVRFWAEVCDITEALLRAFVQRAGREA